jgi:serine/threonine protein kinase
MKNENYSLEILNYEQFGSKYNENFQIFKTLFSNVVNIKGMQEERGDFKIFREPFEKYITLADIDCFRTAKKCITEAFSGLFVLLKKNIIPSNVYPKNFVICTIDDEKKIGKFMNALIYEKDSSKSLLFCSPEQIRCINSGNYNFINTEASIVFSAGMFLYYILTKKRHLFYNEKHRFDNGEQSIQLIIQNILNKNFKIDYSTLKDSVDPWEFELSKDLIEKMTFNDATKRISIEQVVNHSFFWSKEKCDRFFYKSFMDMSDPIDYYVDYDLILRTTLKDWRKTLATIFTSETDLECYSEYPSGAVRFIRNLVRENRANY